MTTTTTQHQKSPSPPPLDDKIQSVVVATRATNSWRSASTTTERPVRDYKPTALRWWFLLLLAVCLAVLIGLTEYVIRTLPLYMYDLEDLLSGLASRDLKTDATYGGLSLGEDLRVRDGSQAIDSSAVATASGLQPTTVTETITTTAMPLSASVATVTEVITSFSMVTQPASYFDNGQTTITKFTTIPQEVTLTIFRETTVTEVEESFQIITVEVGSPSGSTGLYGTEASSNFLAPPGKTTIVEPDSQTRSSSVYFVPSDTTTRISVTAIATSTSAGFLNPGQTTIIETHSTATSGNLYQGQTTIVETLTLPHVPRPSDYLDPGETTVLSSTSAEIMTVTSSYLDPGKTSVTEPESGATATPPPDPANLAQDQSSPIVVIVEHATTDSNGRVATETQQVTIVPVPSVHDTSDAVIVQKTTAREVVKQLLTLQVVETSTQGGTTQTRETTFTDSHGQVTSSLYTTIVGGQLASQTMWTVVETSAPSGNVLVSVPTVVPVTLAASIQVLETTFTDAQGHIKSSLYTKTISAETTSETLWTVVATSVPSGQDLVAIQTAIPTTVGGTTEVFESTYTDAQGHIETSSYTTVVGGTLTLATLWTVIATPIASSTASPTASAVRVTVLGVSSAQYVVGVFIPTILASLLAYHIKLISIHARLMQPFHALATTTTGCTAEQSLFLRFDTWFGAISFIHAIRKRQPIVALSDLLVAVSGLLAPFASVAVSIQKSSGYCPPTMTDDQCEKYGSLDMSVAPGRVLQALMGCCIALLVALWVLLCVRKGGWKTGVKHNPWSIAGIAALCGDMGLRRVVGGIPRSSLKENAISRALSGRKFALGEYNAAGTHPEANVPERRGYGVTVIEGNYVAVPSKDIVTEKPSQPFVLLTWWGRSVMLFVFSCVLIILVYYENSSGDTGFERFMDSQSFGVTFFFTAVGVVLGYCMETMFRSEFYFSSTTSHQLLTMTAQASQLSLPTSSSRKVLYQLNALFSSHRPPTP